MTRRFMNPGLIQTPADFTVISLLMGMRCRSQRSVLYRSCQLFLPPDIFSCSATIGKSCEMSDLEVSWRDAFSKDQRIELLLTAGKVQKKDRGRPRGPWNLALKGVGYLPLNIYICVIQRTK